MASEFRGWTRRESKRRRAAVNARHRFTPEQVERLHDLMRELREKRGTLPNGI